MYGFTGYVKRSELSEPERASVAAAGERIVHRGPDARTTLATPCAQIEFRRLSIMDVAHGRQPLQSREARWPCFMNSEIHDFRDIRGDLDRMNGMCLIIAFDSAEHQTLLLRDLAARWLPDEIVNARKSGFADIVQLVLDPQLAGDLPSIEEIDRSIEGRAA